MINLDIIPKVNEVDTSDTTANGKLIAQIIIFYIGVLAFVMVCLIPPFTIFLPFLLPVIVVIVMGVNFMYFGKFIDRAGKKMQELADTGGTVALNAATNVQSQIQSQIDTTRSDAKNKAHTAKSSISLK
mgnify:CR=1 FL=1|jgi:hypothetical protein